jgi:hypothetical protein
MCVVKDLATTLASFLSPANFVRFAKIEPNIDAIVQIPLQTYLR